MNHTIERDHRMADLGFLAFLDSRRLTSITGGSPYMVGSQSGQSYAVDLTWHTNRDTVSMYATWHCSCQARGVCRHITAVVDMRWAEAAAAYDYDGMDAMKREEL
jgi:hypothetical protein